MGPCYAGNASAAQGGGRGEAGGQAPPHMRAPASAAQGAEQDAGAAWEPGPRLQPDAAGSRSSQHAEPSSSAEAPPMLMPDWASSAVHAALNGEAIPAVGPAPSTGQHTSGSGELPRHDAIEAMLLSRDDNVLPSEYDALQLPCLEFMEMEAGFFGGVDGGSASVASGASE